MQPAAVRLERRRNAEKARRAKNKAAVDSIKLMRGCSSCGYDAHPVALQAHHRDRSRKTLEVGKMLHWSLVRILQELNKCEILCANCHVILTVEQRDYLPIPTA